MGVDGRRGNRGVVGAATVVESAKIDHTKKMISYSQHFFRAAFVRRTAHIIGCEHRCHSQHTHYVSPGGPGTPRAARCCPFTVLSGCPHL